jgi:hypothetical protein
VLNNAESFAGDALSEIAELFDLAAVGEVTFAASTLATLSR